MSAGQNVEATPKALPPPTTRPKGRRKAFLIFFIVLLIAATGAFLYWLHTRDFESTESPIAFSVLTTALFASYVGAEGVVGTAWVWGPWATVGAVAFCDWV